MKRRGFGEIRFPFFISFLILVLFFSCKKEDPNIDPNDDPGTGDAVVVAEETVPVSGGQVVVNAPGNPVDGMVINVPSNSYPEARDFEIETVEITSHDFGEYFNPISPLIVIDNGGGYAENLMEITIPIDLPDGHIPLGFYYDDVDGVLEAIPVHNYSSTSITLLTRHFSPAADLKSGSTKTKSTKSAASTCNMVISSLSESVLQQQTIISSGFKIGVDNWEFVNNGSIVAPGGHCAGQNMTAMWYYYEKKLNGEAPLNNRFSTIDAIWQDNAFGYRFCSVVQNDLASKGLVIDFFYDYIDMNQELDLVKFMTLAGAMLVTGEPQGVGIYKATGTRDDGSTIYSGHDLICHKVSMTEKKLYICDPNHPTTERSISLKNDRFEPVPIALSGEQPENNYPFVTWYAKTAWIDWNIVGNRYNELLNGTIGTVSPNTFPDYSIKVIGDLKYQKENIYLSGDDTLSFYVECPTAKLYYKGTDPKRIGMGIFDENGQVVSVNKTKGEVYTILKSGTNKLGFYVFGFGQYKDDAGDTISYPVFCNYETIIIEYGSLRIEPNPVIGSPGEQIAVSAISENIPSDPKYIWDLGDGDGTHETTGGDVYVTYTDPGNYTLSVELWDNSTNKLVSSATASVQIEAEGSLSISPSPVNGQPNEPVTVSANYGGILPASYYYKWDTGDGNSFETSENSINWTYTSAGSYTLVVELWDSSAGTKLASTFTSVNIEGGSSELLDRLHTYKYVKIDFRADMQSNEEFLSWSGILIYTDPGYAVSGDFPIIWQGDRSFIVDYNYSHEDYMREDTYTRRGSISMRFSSDGSMIDDFSANETISYTTEYDIYTKNLSMVNIPYTSYLGGNHTMYYTLDSNMESHVTSLDHHWEVQGDDNDLITYDMVSVDYGSSNIQITFYNE